VKRSFLENAQEVLFFGMCSLPFHAFYNSAVSETVGISPFCWVVVGEDFVQHGPITPSSGFDPDFSSVYPDIHTNGSNWDKLSNLECIQAYGADIITDRRNVLVVTTNSSRPDGIYEAFLVQWGTQSKGYTWMCPLTPGDFTPLTNNTRLYSTPINCSLSSLEKGATEWALSGLGEGLNPYDSSEALVGVKDTIRWIAA
jgi:hypothetical protein